MNLWPDKAGVDITCRLHKVFAYKQMISVYKTNRVTKMCENNRI